jgi:glucose/arabinose dehydrogenase
VKPLIRLVLALLILSAASLARGELLPGFRIDPIAKTSGFCSGIAADPRGTLYYTTQSGDIYRLDGGVSTHVVHIDTVATGNAGLLGVAMADDHTAIVHYTRGTVSSDVISRFDLTTGSETVLHEFVGDIEQPGRGVNGEHHGGNPIITADGTVYVGIGDYGSFQIAALPQWNAGKIWRIDPNGRATQLASGFRNPFDLAWEPDAQRLIVPDNGETTDDEIDIVSAAGGFFGWPFTSGNRPPYPGAVPPIYVFPKVVAPTGIARLSGRNPLLPRGYLLGSFVTQAVYYIANIDAPAPIALTAKDVAPIVDVIESPTVDIIVATGQTIYRLTPPRLGDCNGDGVLNFADVTALEQELASGSGEPTTSSHRSWGCDANGDGVISGEDVAVLWRMVVGKAYAVRHR